MGPAGRAPLPAANASDVILAETTIFVGAVAFAVRDVVAATVVGTAVDISTLAKPLPWTGCRGRRDASRGKPQPRTLSVRRVRFGNYAAAAAAQRSVVERLAEAFPKAPGSALVFINPAGGTGNAEKLYNSEVSPIFAAANVDAVVCVTSRQHEAYDRCRELAASAGAGAVPAVYICVVGGDGTLAEVVKGLVEGCAALPDAGTRLRQSFRLAHIPGGSGNACAASIAHACNDACSAADVAYYVVRGESRPLDLAKYEHGGPSHTPSFLALEWAIVADIDLGSEHMRWLGPARFTVAALRRILCLREYRGRLSYLPMAPKRGYYDASALPRLDEPLTLDWVQVPADNFQLLMACNVSHIDETTPIAPAAELDDGAFHLVYTCGPASLGNRVRLLDAFLKLDEAKHVESRFCNVVKCAAFRLEPLAGDTSRMGLDGEEVVNAAIQAEMCHAALTFCCSPDAK